MAELDDALLDDDIASLPDINDEETELDFDNDDTTTSTQEDLSDQLSCDLESSLEDILDMTDLDACEENEYNVVNLESESIDNETVKHEIDNEIVKHENVCSISSTSNEPEVGSHDEDILSSDESSSLPDNNCRSESRFKTVEQGEPRVQNNQSFHVNDSEFQLHQSSRKECGSHNFNRVSNDNHSYIQPSNEPFGPPAYQSCYNFQDQSINVGLNTSFFNEPPAPGTYPLDNFANQSHFWHNSNNGYTNYGCHPTMSRYFYQSAYQSPPITNQMFPQTIQMLHDHVPMMTNTCQPFLSDSSRFSRNISPDYLDPIHSHRYSRNISPDYLDPIHSQRSASESPELPQYVVNPLYKQNHSSKQKVLINRHFGQIGDRREYFLNDEFRKSDLFLKKIAPQKLHPQHRKNLSQSTNNMDPYSYFSDIWQTKDGNKRSRCSLKRSISPEVLSNTLIRDNQKHEFKKNERQQPEQKRPKMCTTKTSCSTTKKASNTRKTNVNFKRNCRKKRKNDMPRAESIGNNNNTSTSTEKDIARFKIKKEEKMDLEMIEYCKKIEEQKRRRDEFLQIKETRRKLLAMEKIGIKKEPIADELS